MNIAVIFAGGVGKRMNTRSKPKQFLELHGKPIIIYTLEIFENHPEIDGIVVSCVEDWIPYLNKMIKKYELSKVKAVIPGGDNGQESIYLGLKEADKYYPKDSIVLIHDGVRPLVDDSTISQNIQKVKECGSCITCVCASETLVVRQPDGSLEIPTRSNSMIARAPQSFILKDILTAHERAIVEGKKDFIDSCTMMSHYDYRLGLIEGPVENIKITTPADFYIFRALNEVHENQQIFGL